MPNIRAEINIKTGNKKIKKNYIHQGWAKVGTWALI
jgi:hypothetical protein